MEMLRPCLMLIALGCAALAQETVVATSHHGSRSSYSSSGSASSDKYYGQWTVDDLSCYIAKDKVNGEVKVMKQCRKGPLGEYHTMTKEEEDIITAEISRMEMEKKAMQQKIAQSNAVLQNTMRSMNNEIQKSIVGMHEYMNQMKQMMHHQMQQTFANAFGPLG